MTDNRLHDPRLYKVIGNLDDGTVAVCTAIEHQGRVWIVPRWLALPDEGYARPERMILLDQFRHERCDPSEAGPDLLDGADFRLPDPIPRSLFDGVLSPALREEFVVLDAPNVSFRPG